jgi:hypothetical protein
MMAAMIDSGSAIVAAAVTGSISLIVWTLNALVTSWREVRARRDETRKRFLERQIEEFYGPLLALSRQRNAIHDIRERLFAAFESDDPRLAVARLREANLEGERRAVVATRPCPPARVAIRRPDTLAEGPVRSLAVRDVEAATVGSAPRTSIGPRRTERRTLHPLTSVAEAKAGRARELIRS